MSPTPAAAAGTQQQPAAAASSWSARSHPAVDPAAGWSAHTSHTHTLQLVRGGTLDLPARTAPRTELPARRRWAIQDRPAANSDPAEQLREWRGTSRGR
jgi:hypothetical protein